MLAALEYRARLAVRRTMFGVVSGLLFFIGIAFLAVAGWMVLVQFLEPLYVALIFSGVFLGFGFIALALSHTHRAKVTMAPSVNAPIGTVAPAAGAAAMGGIASALIQGISVGMAAGKARHKAPEPEPEFVHHRSPYYPDGYDPRYHMHH